MQSLFNRGSMPALESMMRFSSLRHRAIAHNLANAATPGYRAVDVPVADFQKTLSQAFRAQRQTPTGVFEMGAPPSRFVPAADAGRVRTDGNNVDIDLEMGRMVKNAQLHALASSLLAHQFAQMRTAISERIA